jgi:alpha-L-fucosidase 2
MRIILSTILLAGLGLAGRAQEKQQNGDLKLWYRQPARQWEECVPLGNGRLGMTPDGGVQKEDIVLNEISLWSGSVQDANNYDAYKFLPEIRKLLLEGKNDEAEQIMEKNFICKGGGSGNGNGARLPFGSYQVLGTLTIRSTYSQKQDEKPAYANYQRELSLDSAMATCVYQVNGVNYKKQYFTAFGSDVDVIRITADKPGQINCSISISRPEAADVAVRENTLQMSGQLNNGAGGGGMKYLSKVKAVTKNGTLMTVGTTLVVKDADELIIYVSAATDFENPSYPTRVDELLANAVGVPYSQQVNEHVSGFRKLFDRVSVRMGTTTRQDLPSDLRLAEFQKKPDGDNQLAALYFQFGRYLAISSTRVGLLPPNLQGLWANQVQTPWNSDYHLDVNLEMNDWPFNVCNLSELDLPLVDLVKNLVPHGKTTARAYYNADGWVAHVITNVWQFTEPGESATWGSTKSGSGWLCNNLWQHYEFTGDIDYLREIYPILKGAAAFYKSTMIRDPRTGWLVTAPSSSPENAFYLPNGHIAHVCIGPTIDNQIVRELYTHLIAASKALNIDAAFRDTLEFQLTQTPPPGRIAPDGRIMEWLENYKETEVTHRHISHLYGLYPANLITPDSTPDLAEASKKTLEARGDDGPSWSLAYKMCWWARLYNGNRAYKLYLNLIRPTTATSINYGPGGGIYANFFSAGPPFQIDANFGGIAGIAEMLLQSHAGYINLLPALPDQWKKEGEVRGLKARGNLLVDFKWKDGRVTEYTIHSSRPQTIKVKINGDLRDVQTIGDSNL